MTVTTSPEHQDRRTRDARIRELHGLGWSNARIGAEVGLTREGIRKILRSGDDPDALLARREAELRAELDELVRHAEANRRQIRAKRRVLDRIEEEREVARIDELLGLS